MHLEDLTGLGCCHLRFKTGGNEQMQHLCEYAWGTETGTEAAPLARAYARFFDELALCGCKRWLIEFELAGGQFPDPTARSVPILAQQADPVLRVDSYHCRATWMVYELEPFTMPIRQNHVVHCDGDYPAAKIGAALLYGHEALRRSFLRGPDEFERESIAFANPGIFCLVLIPKPVG